MTVCAVILSAMVSRIISLLTRCEFINYRAVVVGSVKDGFQFPLYVECGLLRRLG